MITSNHHTVISLIKCLKIHGIEDVILSPGSRNAPLAIAFYKDSYFNCTTVVDERSAGFIALGMSLRTNKPTVICCTSGSAAANYAPALVEAYYQNVSIIAITADRPIWAINNGQGQTMIQNGMYRNHIRKEAIVDHSLSVDQLYTIYVDVIEGSTHPIKGPVHINIHFEEPLYGITEYADYSDILSIERDLNTDLRIPSAFWEDIETSTKTVLIIGQSNHQDIQMDFLSQIAKQQSILILTECTSNVDVSPRIEHIDQFLEGSDRLEPELVITCGGAIVSKRIKSHFPGTDTKHWDIRKEVHQDLFQINSYHLDQEINVVLKAWISHLGYPNDWVISNLSLAQSIKNKHLTYAQSVEWSDFKIFDFLSANVPSGSIVHLANSTAIRYAQLFDWAKGIKFQSNRGVSGIDGSVSTAHGYASKSQNVNLLISGDLSFFYDSNAFWNHLSSQLKIIVINNQGGGIFRYISGPDSTEILSEHFEAHHKRTAEDLCKVYDINYLQITSLCDLHNVWEAWYMNKSNGIQVMEIMTPRKENDQVLKNYFKALSD